MTWKPIHRTRYSRVSVPSSFAVRWLASRLPSFQRNHPALELDIELDDRQVNLTEQGFDCAIRIATGCRIRTWSPSR